MGDHKMGETAEDSGLPEDSKDVPIEEGEKSYASEVLGYLKEAAAQRANEIMEAVITPEAKAAAFKSLDQKAEQIKACIDTFPYKKEIGGAILGFGFAGLLAEEVVSAICIGISGVPWLLHDKGCNDSKEAENRERAEIGQLNGLEGDPA